MKNLIVFFRKRQKLLFVLALLSTVLFFVYSLCFSTDLYRLFYFMDLNGQRPNNYVPGSRIYLEAQNFNRLMLDASIALIVITILLFVFLGQRRRIYYLSNIITITVYSVVNFALSILMIFKITYFKNAFLNGVDFEKYYIIAERMKMLDKYSKSTFWLDVGYFVSIVMLVVAILMITNMLLRLSVIKKERKEKLKIGNIAITSQESEALENKFTANFIEDVEKVIDLKEDAHEKK